MVSSRLRPSRARLALPLLAINTTPTHVDIDVDSTLSTNIHLTLRPTSRIPPLLPHIKDELIQHPRPRPVLAPPTHTLILQALHGEDARLIPHIFTNTLLPPRL